MGFRFLVLSHTLLSYLSGLGAHRDTELPGASEDKRQNRQDARADDCQHAAQIRENQKPHGIRPYKKETSAYAAVNVMAAPFMQ